VRREDGRLLDRLQAEYNKEPSGAEPLDSSSETLNLLNDTGQGLLRRQLAFAVLHANHKLTKATGLPTSWHHADLPRGFTVGSGPRSRWRRADHACCARRSEPIARDTCVHRVARHVEY